GVEEEWPSRGGFLEDRPKDVERKIKKALTGGRATVEEQRRLGAVPEICSVWAQWRSKFAQDDAEFDEITAGCRSGALLCGDCKSRLIVRVQDFLGEHAKRKEAVRSTAESLILEGGERSDASGPVVRGEVPLP
ncbi:MAG: hypothetical protein WAN40_03525, partial [Thermoplasmata archaeon]